MQIRSAKDLEVYKKSYHLAMEIFELSKSFPAEEKYALTRTYPKTCFISKSEHVR